MGNPQPSLFYNFILKEEGSTTIESYILQNKGLMTAVIKSVGLVLLIYKFKASRVDATYPHIYKILKK